MEVVVFSIIWFSYLLHAFSSLEVEKLKRKVMVDDSFPM
jgi:hypothetical protein